MSAGGDIAAGVSPPVRTTRLTLAWPTPEQVTGFYHAIVGTDIFETLIWAGPSSVEELQEYWSAARGRDSREKDLALAAIETATGVMVGSLSLRLVNGWPEVLNFGYVVAKAFHNKGYGTEMARAAVDLAMARGAERFEARVFVGNIASRRALEKAGFVFEGTLRRAAKTKGKWHDDWMFSVIRSDRVT